MSTIKVSNLQNASAASPAFVLASDGSATANLSSLNGGQLAGTRNRIINGDMRIDQRNAGASVTPTVDNQYVLDRWRADLSVSSKYSVQQNAAAVTPPTGFTNYLGVTSLSAYGISASDYFMVEQVVEGFNVSDLGWGSASATSVTLSFKVRSSLTGTFGGSAMNSAANRSYPFTYSISTANTWETKAVTIPGDTTGTWATSNGIGIRLFFGLGVGTTNSGTAGAWAAAGLLGATGATSVVATNGATFYITGVQLEPGSTATPFERTSYSESLARCQRYFEKSFDPNTAPNHAVGGSPYIPHSGSAGCGGNTYFGIDFKVTKRAAPAMRVFDPVGAAAFSTNVARFVSSCNSGFPTTVLDASASLNRFNGYIQGSTDTTILFWWTAEAEL